MSSERIEYTPVPIQYYSEPTSRRGLTSEIEVTQLNLSPAQIRRQQENDDRAFAKTVLESVVPGRRGQMCAGKSEYFFSESGDTARIKERKERVAKTLCANCPVIKDCLDESVSEDGIDGIWGGKTAFERRKLFKRKRYQ